MLDAAEFGPDLTHQSLEESLGINPSIEQIVALLDLLRFEQSKGNSYAETLQQTPERARGALRDNFENETSPDRWVTSLALAFLSGLPRSKFEDRLQLLREASLDNPRQINADNSTYDNGRWKSSTAALQGCGGEVAKGSLEFPSGNIVRLSPPSIHPIYFEECWHAAPIELRSAAKLWLKDSSTFDNESIQIVAGNVQQLACCDPTTWRELIDVWASIPKFSTNLLAAASVTAAAGDADTHDLAIATTKGWTRSSPNDIGRLMSASFTFGGPIGLSQIRTAVRFFRAMRTRESPLVSASWLGLSDLCAHSDRTAIELVHTLARLRAVRELRLTDPAFALLGLWFQEHRTQPPRALLLATSNDAIEGLGSSVASAIRGSYGHTKLLVTLLPWADSLNEELGARALAIIDASLQHILAGPRVMDARADRKVRYAEVIRDLRHWLVMQRQHNTGAVTDLAAARCEDLFCSLSTTNQ